jgi:tetratricopeptide (TPR) repeat protein
MAIALPGLDKLPDGSLRDFVSALHEIYDAAGQPAARLIAKGTAELPSEFPTVSHETVSATLRASALPAWQLVRSMLHVLTSMAPSEYVRSGLEHRMNRLWRQARRELQSQVPPAVVVAAQQRPPAAVPVIDIAPQAMVRSRPAHGFVGREELLAAMRSALDAGPDVRLVLYGPVGTGKTQTVLQFLQRHVDARRPVWWVPAGTVHTVHASLVLLAATLGVEQHHRTERTVRLVLERLESDGYPFLMVFDSFEGTELLRLVPNGGHVVITTRDPALGRDSSSVGIEVADLTFAEAHVLLRQHDPDVAAARIREVADTYGLTPLALKQVAAWSRATGTPLGGAEGVDAAERLTRVPADGYAYSASRALLMALDRLEAASRPALMLLEVLACFGAAPVSKQLLGRGLASSADALRGEVALNKAIAELLRHGLARLVDEGRRVEVMPLARLVVRRALSREETARAQGHAHALLVAADPGQPDGQSGPQALHGEIALHLGAAGLVDARDRAVREAVLHQVRHLQLVGDHARAEELGEEAYTRWRLDNDPSADDHLLLRVSHEWADALRSQGRYQQASELTRNAMSVLRADPAYGENHPHTLDVAGGRAADLRVAGEYRRAGELAEDTLRRCEVRLGERHWRTVASRHDLAVSLRFAGDFAAAEHHDRIALRQHRELFGDGDWRVHLSIAGLAEDLTGQGRYQDVVALVRSPVRAADIRAPTPERRWLIMAGRAVALARRSAGQAAEALKQLVELLAVCADVFGERHAWTLGVRMSRATTLHLLGHREVAVEEASLVYDEHRRTFGVGNPLTAVAGINLACALRGGGDRVHALRIDRASSRMLRNTVGREHPFAVAAAVNLASDHAGIEHQRRLIISRHAYHLARRVWGRENHPDVAAAKANYALDLAATTGISGLVASATWADATQGERVDCVVEPPLL